MSPELTSQLLAGSSQLDLMHVAPPVRLPEKAPSHADHDMKKVQFQIPFSSGRKSRVSAVVNHVFRGDTNSRSLE